ncbi:MAG: electron transport complex subunit RsxG [Thiotrichales bacterium]|nr:electron transport complex subunit RsxG [Thiotrichales bacterium]
MFASAGKLSLFVLISIVLLLGVKTITDPLVSEAERQNLLDTLNQVMPVELYDNDPLQDTLLLTDPKTLEVLGSEEPIMVYRARKNGKPAGLILTTIAPNGYSGNIYMLMGILADNRVAGVRVLKHKETPGLGDKIELNKNPWILEFDGRNLRDDNDPLWAVKKDGGDFDQFTGATITPRAVVGQVKRTLLLVKQQSEFLYE